MSDVLIREGCAEKIRLNTDRLRGEEGGETGGEEAAEPCSEVTKMGIEGEGGMRVE